MLTKGDLEKIDKLLDNRLGKKLEPIKERLDAHSVSLIKLERDMTTALEIYGEVKSLRETVKDHEERISTLEKFPS